MYRDICIKTISDVSPRSSSPQEASNLSAPGLMILRNKYLAIGTEKCMYSHGYQEACGDAKSSLIRCVF